MGIPTCKPVHEGARACADRRDDRGKAPRLLGSVVAAGIFFLSFLTFAGSSAFATNSIRVAYFHSDLSRDGPGLLLRDIVSGKDAQIAAVVAVIRAVRPDVLVLADFDFDASHAALTAFASRLEAADLPYPHRFSRAPNSGRASGFDLDRDGRFGRPQDSWGFGEFAGQGGIALLSRFPIVGTESRDFSGLPWRDLPGKNLPEIEGEAFYPADVRDQMPLSYTVHWDVALRLPSGEHVRIWTYHATPPVFDGPEDRNGLRNRDETAFWLAYLAGRVGGGATDDPFVILAGANLDPADGDGRPEALLELQSHPRVQDPRPASRGAVEASRLQGGANAGQKGDPALDTADWPDDPGPGNLRVDYVLPSRDWEVLDAGVFWPASDDPTRTLIGRDGNLASRHRLVWVDLGLKR
ncbi:MAG: endonuclease/exonuclease/phosphatase family protein [Rhodobacteraceae bacterium]|nr:endonuclease/exonuclease/phosphatase family protein [Paracoccaceae bacterium]